MQSLITTIKNNGDRKKSMNLKEKSKNKKTEQHNTEVQWRKNKK